MIPRQCKGFINTAIREMSSAISHPNRTPNTKFYLTYVFAKAATSLEFRHMATLDFKNQKWKLKTDKIISSQELQAIQYITNKANVTKIHSYITYLLKKRAS